MQKLEYFLPTSTEIKEMNKEEFREWIFKASVEIPKRQEERDPLTHLKKRISNILKKDNLTEVEREEKILFEIIRFYQKS
ncbi:hypothetical protein [Virgibacillus chiguensis]|uniref:Uncharacterized protein n=1 Tax=Virgibacillus chiguensis TaxID=411959 RepID=A0A1M5MZG8_9BACI|nr:hypothetical protein [Virgibacillus chiguensis]SHG82595.1 hypothetical protein SAMN05421807_1029 [Virgibacillus chiguensis]